MILVSVGTQKFPFNRLLRQLDALIASGILSDKVIAQVGYSDFSPQYYEYFDFLPEETFSDLLEKCDILITHGGVGTITQGLERKKKVIVVPRMKQFGEHVDNHQIEIAKQFETMDYTTTCYDIEQLAEVLRKASCRTFKEFHFSYQPTAQYVQSYLNTIEEQK